MTDPPCNCLASGTGTLIAGKGTFTDLNLEVLSDYPGSLTFADGDHLTSAPNPLEDAIKLQRRPEYPHCAYGRVVRRGRCRSRAADRLKIGEELRLVERQPAVVEAQRESHSSDAARSLLPIFPHQAGRLSAVPIAQTALRMERRNDAGADSDVVAGKKSVRELGAYGMWADRDDIGEGTEYVDRVRKLRHEPEVK